LCGFSPAHFASPGLCYAKPLFGLAKRRIQSGTLCAICFEISVNLYEKAIDRIKKMDDTICIGGLYGKEELLVL
jgi:hypothetical protein